MNNKISVEATKKEKYLPKEEEKKVLNKKDFRSTDPCFGNYIVKGNTSIYFVGLVLSSDLWLAVIFLPDC